VLDQRGQLLRAALGFAALSRPSCDRPLWALRTWLDSWAGIGHVAVGMARQGYDHQTITMTMRYSHLAPDHLRKAVAVLDDVLPPPELAESIKVSAQASAQELVPAGEVSQKFS
jgi:hypothetical protein